MRLVIKKNVVTKLLIRSWNLSISIVFITQSYSKVPKGIKPNSRHSFIMKTSNKREFLQIAINNSLDIDFRDFIKIDENFTSIAYSFSVTYTTLPSDSP